MTEQKTVDASVLGIVAPVKVSDKIGAVESFLQYQVKLSELANTDTDDWTEFLKGQLAVLQEIKSYVSEALGLSKAQTEKLNELNQDQLNDLSQQLGTALMGWGEVEDEEDSDEGK